MYRNPDFSPRQFSSLAHEGWGKKPTLPLCHRNGVMEELCYSLPLEPLWEVLIPECTFIFAYLCYQGP